jgi:hypothetical protein
MRRYHAKFYVANGLAFFLCLATAGMSASAQTTQTAPSSAPTSTSSDAKPQPTAEEQIATLKARVDQLEKTEKALAPADPPAGPDPHAPAFSDWDWTWLNGNPRNKDVAFDSSFFTPELRADITYTYDFNHPMDDSMSGSSELFRDDEIQIEQLGLGGDIHHDHAHIRFMTQFGMYSTATVRNDPSYSKGQWDIANADRYFSEMYGGYQITNKMHGINIDAGIFMSYVGLFSYYNFDNWAYQPSYVSSNTPWFFEGIRLQFFPTMHLKIEPWIINGWQSYGSSNARKGLGGQIKWTPYSWMNIISNNYGLGHDDFTIPGRGRLHTDNSIEIKYYDKPMSTGIDKMAFSVTADAGCEFGKSQTSPAGWYQQGVSCHGNTKDPNSLGSAAQFSPSATYYVDPAANFAPGVNPKQSMVGYMVYNRFWWHKDHDAITIGGGQLNNPGRYLALVPAINGETATSDALGSPYWPGNPSDPFKAWDNSYTYDFMPVEWLTWRFEYDYRHANVPYWAGHGGSTPPSALGSPTGVNNGSPTLFACNDGTSVPTTSVANYTQVSAYCAGTGIFAGSPHGGLWQPDMRKDEQLIDIDLMVKF